VKALDGPIQPKDIDTGVHFFNAFEGMKDAMETEISANWIVQLCQDMGSWGPFTLGQIQAFYEKWHPGSDFWDNGLFDRGRGFMLDECGKLYPTIAFVVRCYGSAPKKGE